MKHAISQVPPNAVAFIVALVVIYVSAAIGAAGAFASLIPQPFGAPSVINVEASTGADSAGR